VVTSPNSTGSFDNTATVVSTTPDPNTANNRATYTVTATGAASVPTLSTWGLALLALLLLLAGCSARFGRKAHA
jgi:predicted S18 family serine protease